MSAGANRRAPPGPKGAGTAPGQARPRPPGCGPSCRDGVRGSDTRLWERRSPGPGHGRRGLLWPVTQIFRNDAYCSVSTFPPWTAIMIPNNEADCINADRTGHRLGVDPGPSPSLSRPGWLWGRRAGMAGALANPPVVSASPWRRGPRLPCGAAAGRPLCVLRSVFPTIAHRCCPCPVRNVPV